MSNTIDESIAKIKQILSSTLNKLSEWNKIAPNLNQALEEIELLENAEEEAPEEAKQVIDEMLLSQLEVTCNSIAVLSHLTELPKNIDRVVSSSGTSISTTYIRHLDAMKISLADNVHVVKWVDTSKSKFLDFRKRQDRSNQVNNRLSQIKPRLSELHNNAIESSHLAASDIQKSIEAAATLREILDQFKGELLNKCKTGNGNKYPRIADNLVVDSDATQSVVVDSQEFYDTIHKELSLIVKSRKEVSSDLMLDILRQVEDHIWIVTSALDPDKIGFSFS